VRQWRVKIFAASWLLYAAYYFCRKNFPVVMPMLSADSRYGSFDLAHLVFAFSLLYALGQFFAGHLADRFGGRRVAILGATLSITANLAMTLTFSYPLWLGLQLLNGLGQGCGWSAILKLLGAWFHRRERGVVLSWWGTCYVFGGFLATAFATYTAVNLPLWQGLGFRRAFAIPAFVLAAVTFLFSVLTRERTHQVNTVHIASGAHSWRGWFAVLRFPELRVICAAYFLLKTTRYTLLYWLPLYLVQSLGYTQDLAGYSASLFELAGALGPLLAGYCSDRFWGSRRLPVGATLLALLSLAFLAHPLLSRTGQTGVLLSISLMGIFIYGADLIIGGAASLEAVPAHLAARATGAVNCIGSLGQLISSYIVAVFVDAWGWDSLFHFFVLAALAASLLLARYSARAFAGHSPRS
jgi:sugar phosphate permease